MSVQLKNENITVSVKSLNKQNERPQTDGR